MIRLRRLRRRRQRRWEASTSTAPPTSDEAVVAGGGGRPDGGAADEGANEAAAGSHNVGADSVSPSPEAARSKRQEDDDYDEHNHDYSRTRVALVSMAFLVAVLAVVVVPLYGHLRTEVTRRTTRPPTTVNVAISGLDDASDEGIAEAAAIRDTAAADEEGDSIGDKDYGSNSDKGSTGDDNTDSQLSSPPPFLEVVHLKQLQFDPQKLQDDLDRVLEITADDSKDDRMESHLTDDCDNKTTRSAKNCAWKMHGNAQVYSGKWDGVAFLSPSGEIDDLEIVPARADLMSIRNTPLLDVCPYLRDVVLPAFSGHCLVRSARFLRLAAGAVIREHVDGGLQYEYGEARLHIPVRTDLDLVEFVVNGKTIRMSPGEVWYVNANAPHSVANRHPDMDRVHLVLDLVVNDWAVRQFEMALGGPGTAPVIPAMMISVDDPALE